MSRIERSRNFFFFFFIFRKTRFKGNFCQKCIKSIDNIARITNSTRIASCSKRSANFCRNFSNKLFLLFLWYLLLSLFGWQEKFLLLLRFLRNLRPSRGPSLPFAFISLGFCSVCYSSYFCDICKNLSHKIFLWIIFFFSKIAKKKIG